VADTSNNNDEEELETDTEALSRSLAPCPSSGAKVTYDIIHSPSYQVPTLYLTLASTHSPHPPTIDALYARLVPASHKPQLQTIGVMGGLSLTDHPVTGLPVYFIHPCRTAEGIEAVGGVGRDFTAGEYLMLWVGLVGGSVGLNVPVQIALAVSRRDSKTATQR